ncbi:MAG: ferric reductase-like transmembrane domain-containing protein [Candidatus Andersenbacteria bacterium]|nr:ferric reductase-like transmembrane domain-containing protein [bacterium]MDZ4225241.1 ferric reductase-like transmembrane domain-containing protein [Candidatus Andersenbacteria bacterium]
MLEKNWGPAAVFAVTVIPALLWSAMLPWSQRFSDFTNSLTSLAQLAGLTGMALFTVVLILGARMSFFEDYFGGLSRMYVIHHLLGGTALVLLLLHPVLSAVKLLPFSIRDAALSVWPAASLPIALGWLALGLMIILLVLTFYFRPGYQLWKFTHKFLGLAFFLAGLHILLMPSDISRNIWLRGYMLALVVSALVFFVYHSVLNKHRKYVYEVKGVLGINGSIFRVLMTARGERMPYYPGQFAWFSFVGTGALAEAHPFSMSSHPAEKILAVTVKNLGNFTSQLRQVRPGTLVRVQGPYGRFWPRNVDAKRQVWIAGGIGITPFISMAKQMRYGGEKAPVVDLFYATRNKDDAIALTDALAGTSGSLRVFNWFSDTYGRITVARIREILSEDLPGKSFFLCGPLPMMASLRRQLREVGVAAKDIYSEEFEL